MGFDPPAQLRQPEDLCVGQRGSLPGFGIEWLFARPTARQRVNGEVFGGDRPGDDLVVAHLVDVRVHHTGDQRLTQAEAGLD